MKNFLILATLMLFSLNSFGSAMSNKSSERPFIECEPSSDNFLSAEDVERKQQESEDEFERKLKESEAELKRKGCLGKERAKARAKAKAKEKAEKRAKDWRDYQEILKKKSAPQREPRPRPRPRENSEPKRNLEPERNRGPKCHYGTLGLSPSASWSEVRKAYLTLVLQFHPDKISNDADVNECTRRFLEIHESYSDIKEREGK